MTNTSLAYSQSPRPTAMHFDARETGRVVAIVLLAAGPPDNSIIQQANHGLHRLGFPPLNANDFVVSTPEELAPVIPPNLRDAIADLLLELAGQEPLRRRVALAYVALWQLRGGASAPKDQKPNPVTERVARALIGELPRHQEGGSVPEERIVVQANGHYRSHEPARQPAAPVHDPVRARVARARKEMLEVIAAVDQVVIGKHDVVTRVITTMAARGHVLLVD